MPGGSVIFIGFRFRFIFKYSENKIQADKKQYQRSEKHKRSSAKKLGKIGTENDARHSAYHAPSENSVIDQIFFAINYKGHKDGYQRRRQRRSKSQIRREVKKRSEKRSVNTASANAKKGGNKSCYASDGNCFYMHFLKNTKRLNDTIILLPI